MNLPSTIATELGPSVDGASASLLRDLLATLEDALSSAGVPVEHFAPGLEPEEVRDKFAEVGRRVPDEVVEWFRWHNGTSVEPSGRMIPVLPRFEHWTLDMVLRNVREPWLPFGHEPWEWNPDWIQLTGEHGLIVNVRVRRTFRPVFAHWLTMVRTPKKKPTHTSWCRYARPLRGG